MFLYMKPVCKCGHIFDKFSMKPIYYPDSQLYIPYHGVTLDPSHCPKCGEAIEGVVYQHPVDGIFDYDEEKYECVNGGKNDE